MSNREIFRESPLLAELFRKLQKELHDHEGLDRLNRKRYEEKIKNAVDDEEGISALEELLATDPTLADLFGSMVSGKIAASTSADGTGDRIEGEPQPFQGLEFPTFIHRRDKSTTVDMEIPSGEVSRASFLTDVKNNYFTRRKNRGTCKFSGNFVPTFHLFNGRLTFTCSVAKKLPQGTKLSANVLITDNHGSGPFRLTLNVSVGPPKTPALPKPPKPPPPSPTVHAGPSRPDITEVDKGPNEPPLTIERIPNTERLKLLLYTTSQLLIDAKNMRPKEEEPAVAFVFKYGLALAAMGLIDTAKKTEKWKTDEEGCRRRIEETAVGIARVIVPLCLSLPKKLPKHK
jgi:hypothetical protein